MSASLGDKRIEAVRVLADWRAALAATPLPALPVREWVFRLVEVIEGLLGAIDVPPPAVFAGSIVFTPEQVSTMLLALADAIDFQVSHLVGCPDCDAAERADDPTAACDRHKPHFHQGERYSLLNELLGGGLETTP